jgi:hypothetical protein
MLRSTRWFTPLSLAAAALALHAGAALATPALVRSYFADAQVAGPGRLTSFGLHVYDAHLYVPRDFDTRAPFEQPFVLELQYARALKGRAIADASGDEIERLRFGTDEQRRRWHARMAELFPDVEAGRRLAGVHLPGAGARFYFDGRFLGAVDDPDFARAFFSIWLDERTRAPQLRAMLFGQLDARR